MYCNTDKFKNLTLDKEYEVEHQGNWAYVLNDIGKKTRYSGKYFTPVEIPIQIKEDTYLEEGVWKDLEPFMPRIRLGLTGILEIVGTWRIETFPVKALLMNYLVQFWEGNAVIVFADENQFFTKWMTDNHKCRKIDNIIIINNE